jgi:hypothetical protein
MYDYCTMSVVRLSLQQRGFIFNIRTSRPTRYAKLQRAHLAKMYRAYYILIHLSALFTSVNQSNDK